MEEGGHRRQGCGARQCRAGQGMAGHGRAVQGRCRAGAGECRGVQCRARQCSAGQCSAGPGRAGQGRAGQGRAGPGRAGQGRAGQGRAGQGRAGPGRAGQGRAGQGRAGQGRMLQCYRRGWAGTLTRTSRCPGFGPRTWTTFPKQPLAHKYLMRRCWQHASVAANGLEGEAASGSVNAHRGKHHPSICIHHLRSETFVDATGRNSPRLGCLYGWQPLAMMIMIMMAAAFLHGDRVPRCVVP